MKRIAQGKALRTVRFMVSAVLLFAACLRSDQPTPLAAAAAAPAAATGAIGSESPSGATIDTGSIKLFDRGEYFIGVTTNFGSQSGGYDIARGAEAMDRLHLNSYREDIFWHVTPSGSARGSGMTARLATTLATMPQHLVLVLNGGKSAVKNGLPVTDAARRSYADFVAQAVASTKDKSPIYEIWNEWNHPARDEAVAFTDEGSEHDPRFSGNYALLARAAIPAIRSVDPDAKILVGVAAADWTWGWLSGVVRRGGLEGADGLSVHLSNQCHPSIRGAEEMMSRLRELQRKVRSYNRNRNIDIYVTEWAWSTGNTCRVADDFVIASSAQFMFAATATPWIRGIWRYELKDQGLNKSTRMHNYGILDFEFRDKPTTCAARDSAAILRTVRSIGAAPDRGSVRLIIARTAQEYLAIAWDTKDSGTAVVVDGSGSFTAKPICGTARSVGGGRPIPLSAVPVVIRLGKTAPDLSIVTQ